MSCLKRALKRFSNARAIAKAKADVRRRPGDPKSWMRLVTAYISAGRAEEAYRFFKVLVAGAPEEFFTWMLLAQVCLERGEGQEAAEAAKRALALRPVSPAHYLLGMAYLMTGQWEEAIVQFREVLKVDPEDAGAWWRLGIAYEELGEYREALSAYEKSVEIEPGNSEAWVGLASVSLALHNGGAALVAMEQAARLDPRYRELVRGMRVSIGPEAMNMTMEVYGWLVSFTNFVLRNHEVDLVTDAFMDNLHRFDERFIRRVREVREAAREDRSILPGGAIMQMLCYVIMVNLLYVYDNYISKGASKEQIRAAFEESAHKILDGHESLLH